MAFLEDPRLRQRWNQISHNAEAVTENAAAGIWTFQHRYINPCFGTLGESIESCTAPCFGDREERARRARAREREREYRRAEYTFDFYDDWDDDDQLLANSGGGGGGILGGWASAAGSRGEDWDRLIRGKGEGKGGHHHASEVTDQPKRKRGMSYGTRGARRMSGIEEEDPTIIPSTAPLGFLGRLPWKIGGTLRYKPSAAFLQDHPGGAHPDENLPLLDSEDEDIHVQVTSQMRKRSGTTGSGDTSDSFRSRGDLFPSDGEGDEDAIPLDDEFTVALDRIDDRASSNTRSSKGKTPAGSRRVSREVSAVTLSSSTSKSSIRTRRNSMEQIQNLEESIHSILPVSIEDLYRQEEAEAERQEDQEVARKREAARELARERGLSASENYTTGESESRAKSAIFPVEEMSEPSSPQNATPEIEHPDQAAHRHSYDSEDKGKPEPEDQDLQQQPPLPRAPPSDDDFIPARLPNFG